MLDLSDALPNVPTRQKEVFKKINNKKKNGFPLSF